MPFNLLLRRVSFDRNVFILDNKYLKIIQTYFTVDGNIVLEVLSSAKKSIEFKDSEMQRGVHVAKQTIVILL